MAMIVASVAGEPAAQDHRAAEVSDQGAQLRLLAPWQRHPDQDVLLAREAMENGLQARQQHREEIAPDLLSLPEEVAPQRAVESPLHRPAAEGLRRGPRAVAGQLERERRAGELMPPESDVPRPLLPVVPALLSQRVLAIGEGQLREGLPVVESEQLREKDAEAPISIRKDVMQSEHQQRTLRPETDQRDAPQRPRLPVQRPRGLQAGGKPCFLLSGLSRPLIQGDLGRLTLRIPGLGMTGFIVVELEERACSTTPP